MANVRASMLDPFGCTDALFLRAISSNTMSSRTRSHVHFPQYDTRQHCSCHSLHRIHRNHTQKTRNDQSSRHQRNDKKRSQRVSVLFLLAAVFPPDSRNDMESHAGIGSDFLAIESVPSIQRRQYQTSHLRVAGSGALLRPFPIFHPTFR